MNENHSYQFGILTGLGIALFTVFLIQSSLNSYNTTPIKPSEAKADYPIEVIYEPILRLDGYKDIDLVCMGYALSRTLAESGCTLLCTAQNPDGLIVAKDECEPDKCCVICNTERIQELHDKCYEMTKNGVQDGTTAIR